MQTDRSIHIQADPDVIFALASAVERWPEILPHYRWVRVVRDEGHEREVEMAARRDWIPVRWRAVQRLYPQERRITFKHVGGVTRGMDVEWTLTPEPDGVRVRIWHEFRPSWPLVPDWLIHRMVGQFFVDAIAGKTLRQVKMLAEAEARSAVSGSPPA